MRHNAQILVAYSNCTIPQAAIIKTDSEFTAYRSAIIYTPFSSITLLPLIQHIQIVLKSDAVRTELHHFYYLRLIKSITLDLYILHLLPIFTPSISLLCKYFSKEFFPIFRSSWHSLNVKLNTFLATLEPVDMICENAIRLTDSEIHSWSWSDFVYDIPYSYAELINYLKEKRLYINEPVETEEEL